MTINEAVASRSLHLFIETKKYDSIPIGAEFGNTSRSYGPNIA